MVHKKYIKRNGKVYGPYYYKSRRVGDKVISEYVGEKKKRKPISEKLIIRIAAVLLALVFFLLVFLSIKAGFFSGKVVSDFPDNSVEKAVSITGNVVNSGSVNEPEVESEDFSQSVRDFKSWVIVTFKMKGETGEYSYSNTLSEEELNSLIDRDRAMWVSKISN